MSKKNNAIRFAVGDPNNVQSHIWRIWVQGNDVYLGTRDSLNIMKVSLHASGIWRLAYVESFDKRDRNSDRVIIRWTKKEGPIDWFQSINIITTPSTSKNLFNPQKESLDSIQWIPSCGVGRKVFFKIVFSGSNISLEKGKLSLKQYSVLKYWKKADGETVWLLYGETELHSSERSRVNDVVEKLKINIAPTEEKNPVKNARALLFVSDNNPTPENQPGVFDIGLSNDNVFIESKT